MKKQYCKPLAVVENFALSQHIASCQNVMVSNLAIREGCDADAKGSGQFSGVRPLLYGSVEKLRGGRQRYVLLYQWRR